MESGKHLAAQERSPSPLMYAWHEKKYLGAAHGLTGIMYMLMQVGCSLTFLLKGTWLYIITIINIPTKQFYEYIDIIQPVL